MFAKNLYRPERGLRVNVIAWYLLLFVLFYTGLWLEKHLWTAQPAYDLLNVGSIPWYLFAMAAFGASTPIIAKIRGGWKSVIPASIAVGVIAGFEPNLGDLLCSGRILTYAPFYFAGYYTDAARFAKWVECTRAKRWPILMAIGAFIAMIGALGLLPRDVAGTIGGLATGHNPYDSLKAFPSYIDACLRLVDYAIGAVLIIAVSLLTPTRKHGISDLGARTLQVYILHPFVYYPLDGFGVFDMALPYLPASAVLLCICGIIFAFLLALPKAPETLMRKMLQIIRIDNAEQA